ncbi:MAG: hypothetical protein LQ348_004681 [Seirophora lacunosa]|nr:MAG: hypothetical protein LQ348_004681 [Seirophora lacunosa]
MLSLTSWIETTYLDHAGTTPYAKSLMKDYCKMMQANLFGNPHSESPSSLLSTEVVETARHRMLRFFRADPAHFDLVFVANATAAIKLVGEGLRDHGFWYGYHADAHTSLVGLRELAASSSKCFFSDEEVDDWLARGALFHDEEKGKAYLTTMGLFAYPAQSNMNGRRLPLDWPARLRKSRARAKGSVYTLLDAAAYVGTAQLDLSDHASAPDFTALSFYKIFGFPDVGALIVRKEAGHVLIQRPYFGGGTVDMVINSSGDTWKATKQGAFHEALEDGTPAFHGIAALNCALEVHARLYGSMDNVSRHAGFLAAALYDQMSSLTHTNGRRLCTIYKGKTADYHDRRTQAPTIAFNVRDNQGQWIGKSYFEQLATKNGIQLRTGGVCNPGGIAFYLGMSPEEMRENYAEGFRCGNGIDEMNGKPTGIIRVGFGAMSNSKDVEAFMTFLRTFIDQEKSRSLISKSQDFSEKAVLSEKDPATSMGRSSEKAVSTDDPITTTRKPTLDKIFHTIRRFICR